MGGSVDDDVPAFLVRLVERWREQGIGSAGGAAKAELRAFEGRHGVRLPEAVRDYFLHVAGMSPAVDHDLIRFWPLDEVSTLAKAWVPAPEAERWFVIGDYAMWTWAYVVRLSSNAEEAAPVAVSFGSAELRPIAGSFQEFVEMYLRRDPLVISPDQ